MSTTPKKQTVKAAEKRVIKAEIRTLKQARRKIVADDVAQTKRITREIAALYKSNERSAIACNRETEKIHRRLSILEGRLSS